MKENFGGDVMESSISLNLLKNNKNEEEEKELQKKFKLEKREKIIKKFQVFCKIALTYHKGFFFFFFFGIFYYYLFI